MEESLKSKTFYIFVFAKFLFVAFYLLSVWSQPSLGSDASLYLYLGHILRFDIDVEGQPIQFGLKGYGGIFPYYVMFCSWLYSSGGIWPFYLLAFLNSLAFGYIIINGLSSYISLKRCKHLIPGLLLLIIFPPFMMGSSTLGVQISGLLIRDIGITFSVYLLLWFFHGENSKRTFLLAVLASLNFYIYPIYGLLTGLFLGSVLIFNSLRLSINFGLTCFILCLPWAIAFMMSSAGLEGGSLEMVMARADHLLYWPRISVLHSNTRRELVLAVVILSLLACSRSLRGQLYQSNLAKLLILASLIFGALLAVNLLLDLWKFHLQRFSFIYQVFAIGFLVFLLSRRQLLSNGTRTLVGTVFFLFCLQHSALKSIVLEFQRNVSITEQLNSVANLRLMRGLQDSSFEFVLDEWEVANRARALWKMHILFVWKDGGSVMFDESLGRLWLQEREQRRKYLEEMGVYGADCINVVADVVVTGSSFNLDCAGYTTIYSDSNIKASIRRGFIGDKL